MSPGVDPWTSSPVPAPPGTVRRFPVPRRGRHRTTLPMRILAIVAALLVTGGVVTVAGSAFADSDWLR